MAYRLLLDENVEYEVLHRLENYGHDVEHVDFVRGLGKGTDDDDFVLEVDEDDYRAVL